MNVLLTGATGVVGSAVGERLLADPAARLHVLIRAADEAELDERLGRLLAYWHGGGAAWAADREALRSRVEAHRGDTTRAALGLSADAYARLAAECTHVIHCASAVRMNLPIDAARESAVGGTRNALAFAASCARAGTLRKVEIVSTVGVGGRRREPLPEGWIATARAFHNTYEQAKSEAEVVAMEAAAHDVPLTVHRPSMVIGDTFSGRTIHVQIFHHLAEFLSGRRTLGVLPHAGPTRLDVVPSDHVAAAIAWSAGTTGTVGRVLHLCAGPDRALPIAALRERVRARFQAAGLRLPPALTVPPAAFRAMIAALSRVAPARQRRALATVPTFLDYLAEDPRFENRRTLSLLGKAGIGPPDIEAAVDRTLDHYLQHRVRP